MQHGFPYIAKSSKIIKYLNQVLRKSGISMKKIRKKIFLVQPKKFQFFCPRENTNILCWAIPCVAEWHSQRVFTSLTLDISQKNAYNFVSCILLSLYKICGFVDGDVHNLQALIVNFSILNVRSHQCGACDLCMPWYIAARLILRHVFRLIKAHQWG